VVADGNMRFLLVLARYYCIKQPEGKLSQIGLLVKQLISCIITVEMSSNQTLKMEIKMSAVLQIWGI